MSLQPPDGQVPDDVLAAVLKLTELSARVERVDQAAARQMRDLAAACRQALERVAAIRAEAGAVASRADGIEGKLAQVDALLAQMSGQITKLAERPAAYQVNHAPPWWEPDSERCADTTARLRDWVDEVYRPGFGHLGTKLGPCWDRHPLCIAYLDVLHEAWSLLYIPPRTNRLVFAQLDWLTRPLLQAAEIMATETRSCLQGGHRDHVAALAQGPARLNPRP